MHIQPFESSRFTALAEAMHELDQHYFAEHGATLREVETSLRRGMLGSESGVTVVLAIDKQEVAGLATYALLYPAPQQSGQLFMKDLFVRQRWRSQGVGEMLMQYLAAYAMQNNCIRFDWTTETQRPPAKAGGLVW